VPRNCLACEHPRRNEIDERLMAGEAFASIAREVGLHRLAVARHKSHVERNVAAQQAAADLDLDGDDVPPDADAPAQQGFDDQLRQLVAQASQLMRVARKSGDVRAALQAIRDIRAIVDSQVRLAELAAANPATALNGGPGCVVILPDNHRNEVPDAEMDADVHDAGDRDVDE
jgi:hypothetical protein